MTPDAAWPTVSELTRRIKLLLEGEFGSVRVRGEISNLRRQQSGHCYFSLKDSGATISCVCFRGDVARLNVDLRDGMQVRASGQLNVYEPRGNYQLILRSIEEDGLGRLQAAFLALKQKLAAEGLFDPARKRALPSLPQRIAFVTSETGAALRDFISVLQRRDWRGTLLVIPARVQGREAAAEIAAGIALANAHQLADLLVVGRGGGSLEDLWPFNEEVVARAVAASAIPVISAVGHEIDVTLSDFAADYRAATPTAAAEWICSSREALLKSTRGLSRQFHLAAAHRVAHIRHRLQLTASSLQRHHPRKRLENAALRLDDLENRLHTAIHHHLRLHLQRIGFLKRRFAALRPEQQLRHQRNTLRQLATRLDNASHRATLRRGYAIVRSADDSAVISDVARLRQGQPLRIELRDGSFFATHSVAAPPDSDNPGYNCAN